MQVKIVWGIVGVLAIIMIMLLGIRQIYTAGHQLKPRTTGPQARINETFMEQLRNDLNADIEKTRPLKPLKMKQIKDELPKRRLRKLDEL